MKEFFSYFFGAGDTVEFKYFSLAHILPILLLATVIFLIIKFAKNIKNCKHEERIRLTLAFTLIITEMSYFWRLVGVESLNANPVDHLPITVCGWAIIFCSFLVLTKNQTLFDIAYFWVFAGSTMGVLTPTVITYCGPTRFRYYQFWLEHTLGFIVLFYMMFVHKMRPNLKSMIKSYCALVVLGAVAIMANTMLPGANYLFMAMPEETASILDILPKNYVVRIMVMAILIGILFFLAYLPWLILDIRAKKKALANAGAENTTQSTNETETLDNTKPIKTINTKANETTLATTTKKSTTKKTTTKTNIGNTEPKKSTKTTTPKKNSSAKSSSTTTTKTAPKTTTKTTSKKSTTK